MYFEKSKKKKKTAKKKATRKAISFQAS